MMSTSYPTDLPQVPADRWNAKIEGVLNVDHGDDMNHPHITWSIEASSQDEAERRALAVQHYDYQDDLEGARAEGLPAHAGGQFWFVTIILRPYR